MRSIRVGGRTHCWVVDSLLREQEREHFRVWRGSHFCRARAHIPRLQTSIEIEAAKTALKAGRIVQIEQAVQQEEQAQKSRESTVQQKRPYCTDFRIPYSKKKKARKPRQKVQFVLYGFHTIPMTVILAQISRRRCVVFWKFWHASQGGRTTFIALFWAGTVGTYFEASVQHFGGTEIKEKTCNLLQKILERILRSLAYFLCEDLARLLR
jgi:hypothetical protein